jgi:hypothetical protein
MRFLNRLFGGGTAGEPADKEGRLSALKVVDLIREKASGFQRQKGMVLVNQDGCRLRIDLFDGISACSWNYFNGQLRLDRVGETFHLKPTLEVVLQINEDLRLKKVLEQAFRENGIIVQTRSQYDCSARIPFERNT